jgi:adenylyltransferase/sulfurtransferase
LSNLSHEELRRYSRHFALRDFGVHGQEKLKNSSVLVVGAGGLGCPALLYLVAAGVGKIGIIDFDTVHESNLQRQVLFTTNDIGKNKAIAAKERLHQLNPFTEIKVFTIRICSANALETLGDFDVIVDGSDNFPTRYLLNDACVLLNKPLVYGSVLEYEGHVSVFNILQNNHYSSNYRDIFPIPPLPSAVPNCEQAGVLGVLPGIIGSMQANEVIKILTGNGDLLTNKLLLLDSQSMDISIIHIKDSASRDTIKELIDYDAFCNGIKKEIKPMGMKEITVQELHQLKQSGEDFQLIDVREAHEHETGNINGELIPMAELPYHVEKISRIKKVVVHCRSGSRSAQAIMWLEKNHNFENLFNLKGGITAWVNEIDSSILL